LTDLRSSLDRVIELERSGDAAAARREGQAALAADPSNPDLLHFLGRLSCRNGALAEGESYLRRAVEIAPEADDARADLVMALAALGRGEEALKLCADASGGDLSRVQAQVLQSMGRNEEAAAAYERVVAAAPDDWEIWNNLASVRWAAGDSEGALAALRRAAALRPDLAPVQANLGSVLAAAGELEEALGAYERALALAPGEPRLVLTTAKLLRELGRSEGALQFLSGAPGDPEVEIERGRNLSALRRLDEAERAYRSALRGRRGFVEAFLELGIALERSGRVEALRPLLDQADAEGLVPESLAYLRALLLESEGQQGAALEWAQRADPALEPARVQRLIAKLADREGQAELAYGAAERANRLAAEEVPAAMERATRFRGFVQALIDTATDQWLGRAARGAVVEDRPAPAFLVGFPRSGTTLLDTILMGHKQVHVLEEIPLLEQVMSEVGDMARVADLPDAEIARLRAVYFSALDAEAAPPPGSLVIDKLPLNILGTPLIHRLFPDAHFIFALRHPCDVALSCFMQGFEVNDAMANFLDIETTARLYDLVLTFWERCRQGLPLRVHKLRYEALLADAEAELRPLIEFLGLPWDANVLDHRRAASERGLISTPSYNQVTQGLYDHAVGRWTRYREQLDPVLPILEPWAARLGYEAPPNHT
jgi:tetratricopeptide (TPR) repeat protein